jgi:hypothetical protein
LLQDQPDKILSALANAADTDLLPTLLAQKKQSSSQSMIKKHSIPGGIDE